MGELKGGAAAVFVSKKHLPALHAINCRKPQHKIGWCNNVENSCVGEKCCYVSFLSVKVAWILDDVQTLTFPAENDLKLLEKYIVKAVMTKHCKKI